MIVTRSSALEALERMVITLFCLPILPAELKETEISSDLPGMMGPLGLEGWVHPQVTWISEIISGAFPVFLNRKVQDTTSPWVISPKSCVAFSKAI